MALHLEHSLLEFLEVTPDVLVYVSLKATQNGGKRNYFQVHFIVNGIAFEQSHSIWKLNLACKCSVKCTSKQQSRTYSLHRMLVEISSQSCNILTKVSLNDLQYAHSYKHRRINHFYFDLNMKLIHFVKHTLLGSKYVDILCLNFVWFYVWIALPVSCITNWCCCCKWEWKSRLPKYLYYACQTYHTAFISTYSISIQ